MTAGPDVEPVPARSLSPSRAADFLSCPLRYRFRVVDHLPEPPSAPALRGTLVHSVLERLFDHPAGERTRQQAVDLLTPCWADLRHEGEGLFADEAEEQLFLRSAQDLVHAYFELERPERLEPRDRELRLEHEIAPGLVLRGIVDRLDEAPDGRTRVVDYKTGRSPGENWEGKALFQVKFYALLLWRSTGRVPTELLLMYLANQEVLRYAADADELVRFERTVLAVAAAIATAHETRRWDPKPSTLCSWCNHRSLCPAKGGTPPPYPEAVSDERHEKGDDGGAGAVVVASTPPTVKDSHRA